MVLTALPQEVDGLAEQANMLAENLGVATLLFFGLLIIALLFWALGRLYIQSQAKDAEEKRRQDNDLYKEMIENIKEDRKHSQQILLSALEDNRQQIAMTGKMFERLKSQEQATQIILDKMSSMLENRCIHQLQKQM